MYVSLYKAGPDSGAHVLRWSLEGELALQYSTLSPLPLQRAGRRSFDVLHCDPTHSTAIFTRFGA